ncbi:MAG: M1 family metallopeptidase [Bryobacteraceae bacterium]|jgi:alanyl aminopeptidase
MKTLILLTIAGALFAAPQPPVFRLPSDAVPARYRLELTLDPAKDSFSGIVTIDLKVRQATTVVWLNASRMSVSAGTLEQSGSTLAAKLVPGGDDFIGFEFDHPLGVGDARLRVEYMGKVNLTASAGVFLSKRNDDRYLFTQFEPIDARGAFPCFDEPAYKVPWQLTLHIPASQVAVSNTPIESETPEGAMKRVVFHETPPLPSYLIAFGVGPLEFVGGGTACRNKVPVRIVVPRGDAPRAAYAAQVTADILTRLEEYFDIPYPFEKADQLAIPLSFGGAMENPGLVTYDAGIILAPPQGADTLQRQREYAWVAAHELAHQWFGDLVTMAWWNDTWLNESFATFMEQKIVSTWKPEWTTRVDDQGSRNYALWLDRLATARRIDQPVQVKSDIANAFDGITYQKGAAVLTMTESSISVEKFRQAARFYLLHHARSSGTAQDFLDALGEAAGPPVPASFRSFLEQPGAPEIVMQLKCDGDKARIEMRQQRFLPLGSTGAEAQTWKVPVRVAYQHGDGRQVESTTLETATGVLALNSHGCPAWFLGNAGEAGYYYTHYDGPALRTLVENWSQLSLVEQAGLFGELDNVAKAGILPLSVGLQLAVMLKDEPTRQIIDAALQFAAVRIDFLPENLRPNYVAYVRDNFGARARNLGWIPKLGESEDDRLLRPSLVGFVARDGEDPELIAGAKELAAKWLATRQPLPAEMFYGIFNAAARNGDASLYEKILASAKAEKDEFFLEALIGALGSFRTKELVLRNMKLLLDGAFDMRLAASLLFGPLSTPELAGIPLDLVKSNYDAIVAKLPSAAGSDYAAYLPQTAGRGCSAEEAREAQDFFGPRMAKVNGGPRNLAQLLESIRLCEARKKVQQPDLVQFFQGR